MEVTRERAWETLTRHTKSEALLRHAPAVEARVAYYAREQGEDEELWSAVALLHRLRLRDAPHPRPASPGRRAHPPRGRLADDVIEAVLSHAEHLEIPRDTPLKEDAVRPRRAGCFVHACGSLRPDGIETLEPKSGKKKLKQPSFAAASTATRSTAALSRSARSTTTSATSSRPCA